ncbi:calpastatin [Rhizobium sp. Leaf311]|nr:calpastatin [Rhizobium sp. Leaf311]
MFSLEERRVVKDNAAFDLHRFTQAQDAVFETVLQELKDGKKRTHWMWFIFPQIAGLGSSSMAQIYSIGSEAEARSYLNHQVLGERLKKCVSIVLGHKDKTAHDIFGSPDDLKFRSCLTLFEAISPEGNLFEEALKSFYDGHPDEKSLSLLNR